MLILVSALEVGVWPYLGLSAAWLLLFPLPFIALARLLRNKFTKVVVPGQTTGLLRGSLAFLIIIPVVVWPLVAHFLNIGSEYRSGDGPLQWFTPGPWIRFGTLLGAFVAALLLFNRSVWRAAGRRTQVIVFLFVFLVLVWVWVDRTVLSTSSPSAALVGSAAVLALLAATMVVALSMSPGDAGIDDRHWCVPLVSLMVLAIGVEASLPVELEPGAHEIVGFVVILGLLGLVWSLVYTVTPRSTWSAHQLVEGAQALHPRSIAVWIGAFMFACPVWLLLAAWARSGGSWDRSAIWAAVSGQSDALWVLLVNLLWIVVIWAIAIYRLDKILWWAFVVTVRKLPLLLRDLMVGLPALVLFTAFHMLTSDTWLVLSGTGAVQFWSAVGGLLAMTIAFLLAADWPKVFELDRFPGTDDLLKALKPTGNAPDDVVDRARQYISAAVPRAPGEAPGLTPGARANVLLVLVFFQLVVLALVDAVAALVFWYVASQVVTEDVASTWITSYRDLQITPSVPIRVVILLTSFATLYMSANLAVSGRRAGDNRDAPPAGLQDVADDHLSERLAIRRVHYALADNLSGSGGPSPA